MIQVSPEFDAAQSGQASQVAYLIQLILGNYAASGLGATASSSGDDASGNYPAAGAIDSDRTEINIGAASAADNGVGKSSWKSSTTPTGGSPVTLTIAFNATRTFNRVKLYNLAADPLISYKLQWWDGAAWNDFAGTSDQFTPAPGGIGGYGMGEYGGGPYGGQSPYFPGMGATGNLDQYDVPDVTTTQIRLVVYGTKNSAPAQVVEIEVYRKVDITNRVTSFRLNRAKDFKLANPIATTLEVEAQNVDSFFSPSYVPTSAQVAAGFVNPELALLGFNIELNEGFQTNQGVEYIRTFTGSVDTLTVDALPATAKLSARDFMKHLINQVDSANLKTSVDIASALQYLLNRSNISTYETSLAQTTITLDYFFTFETAVLTTIQQLVQAAGDAAFFFDENGLAVFNYFLSATPQFSVISTQSAWQGGLTVQNLDTTSVPNSILRKWFLIDDFADNDYTSNPVWTLLAGSASAATGDLVITGTGSVLSTPYTGLTTGTWRFNASGTAGTIYFFCQTNAQTLGVPTGGVYGVQFDSTNTRLVLLRRNVGGTQVNLLTAAVNPTTTREVRVTRTSAGLFEFFVDGVSYGTVNDTNFTTSAYVMAGTGNVTLNDISWSGAVDGTGAYSTAQATWESNPIDQGAAVSAESTFQATVSAPGGSSATFYTATSADGVAFNAYQPVSNGQQIPSPVLRYIKVKAVLNCPIDDGAHNANFSTPTISNITLNWLTGAGQAKFSTSVNFALSYQGDIVDLQQQLSDALGGDTSIVNDVAVTSSPLFLGGAASDTAWQGTTGTPAAKISASNPLVLAVGTYAFNCLVPGGMDTSGMGGGSAIAMTVTVGAATAAITYIHPTKPVLTVTVTSTATITDLRLVGKTFQNLLAPYQATASDAASIARHHKRHVDIGNNYIVNNGIAAIIAARTIANFKKATLWVPSMSLTPRVNMQAGDQVNLTELVTSISSNYYVIGYDRSVAMGGGSPVIDMTATLLPTS